MVHNLIMYFSVRSKGKVSKFQLIKMLYLADLYSVKWTGEQLTRVDWSLYHFGPWSEDIEQALEELIQMGLIRIEGMTRGKGKWIAPMKNFTIALNDSKLDSALENIRQKCTSLSHDELYDFVYATAPMQAHDTSPESKALKKPLDLTLERERLNAELQS